MSILFTPDPKLNPLEKPYDLIIDQKKLSIYIKMSMYTSFFHTNYFPSTLNILSQNLPGVLNTRCYNKNHYNFDQEVLNTEMGHLFEHILLQNLCELKLKNGAKNATYKGITKWNWKKDKEGTFHITLSVRKSDWEIFPDALEKTEKLISQILFSPIKSITIN
jgi:hypothetical protein